MAIRNWILALCGVGLLASCEEAEVILPGKREELRTGANAAVVNRSEPIRLAAQKANSDWTHRIGTPAYRTSHPALSANPQLAWSADIGKGEDKRARITADPVIGGGRIYTMDAEATLAATSLSGERVWARDLTPARARADGGTGGGIAYADGRLYVTTGFGVLKVMDAATGNDIWEQKLGAVGSSTPTVYKGRVYLVSGTETAWALDAENGRVEWQLRSLPDPTALQTPAAPAVNDRLAVFAFGSGEIQGVFRRGGVRLWDAGVTGQRAGRALATVSDISGDPVIEGRTVYAANHSGRLVAFNMDTGERIWTALEGAISPVWPAGDSLFMVSDRNHLLRISKRSGEIIWSVELPLFVKDRPRRQSRVYVHYGPVVAGGHVVVPSSDGNLRLFDPVDGKLVKSIEIPGGAASGPVVAGGVLYVVGAKGHLHAFR